MVPGIKLAATASVIGVIVSEISTGVRGIGLASLTYGQKATERPGAALHRGVRRCDARPADVRSGRRASKRSSCATDRRRRRMGDERPSHRRCRRHAAVVVDDVSMVFNAGRSNEVDALVDIDLSIAPRRLRVVDRAVGLWQVDAAATDREPDRADRRDGARQRQVGDAGSPRPGLRDGVPAVRSVRVADGPQEHRAAARAQGLGQGEAGEARPTRCSNS